MSKLKRDEALEEAKQAFIIYCSLPEGFSRHLAINWLKKYSDVTRHTCEPTMKILDNGDVTYICKHCDRTLIAKFKSDPEPVEKEVK